MVDVKINNLFDFPVHNNVVRDFYEHNSSAKPTHKLHKGLRKLPTYSEKVQKKHKYQRNSEGFRENEFTKDPCIAYFGCSHTEGIGLLPEHLWHSFFHKKAGFKEIQYNCGMAGASCEHIMYRIYQLIKNDIIRPTKIFISFPDYYREFLYTSDNVFSRPHTCFINTNINNKFPTEFHEAWIMTIQKKRQYDKFIANLMFLKYYLEAKNIEWYWSTWMDEYPHSFMYEGEEVVLDGKEHKDLWFGKDLPENLFDNYLATYDNVFWPRKSRLFWQGY